MGQKMYAEAKRGTSSKLSIGYEKSHGDAVILSNRRGNCKSPKFVIPRLDRGIQFSLKTMTSGFPLSRK